MGGVKKGNNGPTTATGDVLYYWGGNNPPSALACNTAIYLRTAANPSASLGLSAVNGTATTWMRSDAAPALSQSITPTWTSLHTFSGGLSATTVRIGGDVSSATGNAGGYGLMVGYASQLHRYQRCGRHGDECVLKSFGLA